LDLLRPEARTFGVFEEVVCIEESDHISAHHVRTKQVHDVKKPLQVDMLLGNTDEHLLLARSQVRLNLAVTGAKDGLFDVRVEPQRSNEHLRNENLARMLGPDEAGLENIAYELIFVLNKLFQREEVEAGWLAILINNRFCICSIVLATNVFKTR